MWKFKCPECGEEQLWEKTTAFQTVVVDSVTDGCPDVRRTGNPIVRSGFVCTYCGWEAGSGDSGELKQYLVEVPYERAAPLH